MHSDQDPIVAISTAFGRGGIGIVRVSVSATLAQKAQTLLFEGRALEPRHATLMGFRSSRGELLDRAIVLYFPAPQSYTGEAVFEIQAHGGPVLLKLILQACLEKCKKIGLRIAEPGEFTKRAFLNGRMDLAQAEAVSDLIDAASESAAHAALRSMTGDFSAEVTALGNSIDELRAYVEATLDFPEEDIDPMSDGRVESRLAEVRSRLDAILDKARQGRVLREGLAVALAGSPNVGKSSLLNVLAGEEIAIVTEIAGTTRDKIEHWVAFDGIPVRIIDTAGVRKTEDIVELKGIERTLQAIENADIVLHLTDASEGIPDDPEALKEVLSRVGRHAALLSVANKADCATAAQRQKALAAGRLLLSVKTKEGLGELKNKILALAQMNSNTEGLYMARERHLECLRRTASHLVAAHDLAVASAGIELFAEELRLASESLGEILGRTTPDDILGIIFSKFCIGK